MPEQRLGDAAETGHNFGVMVPACPVPRHRQSTVDPADPVEDLCIVRDMEDPCGQSDVLPVKTSRPTAAVPSLMTLAQGLPDSGPEVDHVANANSDVAAHRLERGGACTRDRHDLADPAQR